MFYQARIALKGRGTPASDWRRLHKTWNEKMIYLYKTRYGSDIILKVSCGGKETAHRFVLGMSSDVLDAIMRADVFKIPGEATIVFTNVDPDAFGLFLKYIYTGAASFKSINSAIEVFRISDRFNVTELADICLSHIDKNLSEENVMEVYIFADVHELLELKNRCIDIIQNKTRQVVNDGNILKFDVQSLVVLLDQPALSISEIELFKLIEKWLRSCEGSEVCSFSHEHQPAEEVKKQLQHILLSRIRYMGMSAEEFINGPMSTGMLTKSDELAVLGHIISKKCSLKYPVCFNRIARTNLEGTTQKEEIPLKKPSPVKIHEPVKTSPRKSKTLSPPKQKSPSLPPPPPPKSPTPTEPEVREMPEETPPQAQTPVTPNEELRSKTSSMYRANKRGSTPPPTIGVQQVQSVVPSYLTTLVEEKAKGARRKTRQSRLSYQ